MSYSAWGLLRAEPVPYEPKKGNRTFEKDRNRPETPTRNHDIVKGVVPEPRLRGVKQLDPIQAVVVETSTNNLKEGEGKKEKKEEGEGKGRGERKTATT